MHMFLNHLNCGTGIALEYRNVPQIHFPNDSVAVARHEHFPGPGALAPKTSAARF